MAEEKVACRTPNPDKPGVTNIPVWKFDVLRAAILAELSEADVAFSELTTRVAARVSDADKARMGSMGWHVTTVKLEMEVRGEIVRVAGTAPQVLTLG